MVDGDRAGGDVHAGFVRLVPELVPLHSVGGPLMRAVDALELRLRVHIAEELRTMMAARGWSQGQLAEAVGVARPRINRVLNARENLSLRRIAGLALALESHPHASMQPCPGCEDPCCADRKARS